MEGSPHREGLVVSLASIWGSLLSRLQRSRREDSSNPSDAEQRQARRLIPFDAENLEVFLDEPEPSTSCTTIGCGGTMRFHPALPMANAPHTLEWQWHATWACDKDPAHFEVLSDPDATEIMWQYRRRQQNRADGRARRNL